MGYWNTWKHKQVVRVLKKYGFWLERTNKHPIYSNGIISISVPKHDSKDIPEGTLKNIIRQSGIPKNKWIK